MIDPFNGSYNVRIDIIAAWEMEQVSADTGHKSSDL
jgi:hypothetical protein